MFGSCSTTRSATAATVTPDSGKFLSKVTVNTNSVPNSNSGVKTITSSDANWSTGNVDMGAANSYRYVNAVNVYNKGKGDGSSYDNWTYIRYVSLGTYAQSIDCQQGDVFILSSEAPSDYSITEATYTHTNATIKAPIPFNPSMHNKCLLFESMSIILFNHQVFF